jgi:hypothetical protein
MLLSV